MKVGKRALCFLLSLIMLVSVAVSAPTAVFADQPYLLGVDVSEHNKNVDFKALKKKGYDFAMIRVGYVTRKGEFIDKLFYEHVKAAYEAGMFFGVYLYSYACDSKRVTQEADFTIKTIKTLDSKYRKYLTLPVAYDVEDKSIIDAGCKKKQITSHTLQYCNAIKEAGYKPMVYANLNWFNKYIDIEQVTANKIKIWYANWVNNPDFSEVKMVGTTGVKSDMWQYQSGSYATDGIKLDKNVLYPSIAYTRITLSKTDYTYSGTAKKPSVTVTMGNKTLKKDTDYTVTYADNVEVGTATVTIKGKGKFKGSVKKKFTIHENPLEDGKLILEKSSYVYDETAKTPAVTIKLGNGEVFSPDNYTVTYSNNTAVGAAGVKVTFNNIYTGSIYGEFNIKPTGTSISSVTAKYCGFTVKWNQQPTQTSGYQIQYSANSKFTDAKTVTVSGKTATSKTIENLLPRKKYYVRVRTYKTVDGVKYCSSWSSAKSIITYTRPNSISLSTTSCTYNGKVKKPSVIVKDNGKTVSSKYYTVSYQSGRKNVGKYTVTIKFKAPYSGTVKKTFTIKPKATSITKVTAGKKKFTVKWKKQATQTTGYQVQYATNSKFTSAKTVNVTSKNSIISKTFSKLKAKKKYFVRVRTYKTVKVNGKSTKIYSSWSKSKAVTTKK